MVLFDYGLDPGRFAGSILSELTAHILRSSGILHVKVMSPIGSTGFYHWRRVQMIRTHAIDDQLRSLGHRVQVLLVQLNDQDLCSNIVRRIRYQ